jgi:hypothetical protein
MALEMNLSFTGGKEMEGLNAVQIALLLQVVLFEHAGELLCLDLP